MKIYNKYDKYIIDSDDEVICKTQRDIYTYIAKQGYNMELFSNAFLSSDFCKRAFDTIYSRFQFADEKECLDFIIPEIKNYGLRKLNNEYFDEDVAGWIGYTYRQLYIETNIFSAILCEKISFKTMVKYYAGLHTVDENMATDIICNDFHLQKLTYFEHDKIY